MSLLILVAGLLVAAAGALSRHATHRGDPRAWAALTSASTVAAALYVTVGLGLLAAPVWLRLVTGLSLAEACRGLLERFEPGGIVTAWAATGLLGLVVTVTATRAWRSRRRRATLRIPSYVGIHEPRHGFDLVTLPTPTPLAYSLGGRYPQAVISDGLVARLDEAQLAAVVAHEAAHLRWRHQRWLNALDLSAGALWFVPWGRRCAEAARVALECWADEDAAGVVGRAPLRSALLLAVDTAPIGSQIAALNGADAIAERVAMLDELTHRSGRTGPAMVALMAATTIGAAAGVAGGIPQLLALFSHLCPL